jgi:DNA-binding GntR family transcriptional regulator
VIFMRDQLGRSAEQHHAILDAMKKRDGALAERVAREHIQTTMGIVAEALHDD